MKLYNKVWSRRELEARVGRLEQIGGVRRLKWTEGPETDVEQIQVRTGAGLTYYITPSRGLDISLAELFGIPISWQSANGDVHPAYYQPQGTEWLRTAAGGLLMTCGLSQVGSPSQDEGESLGLHGRAHHLPARQVAAVGRWTDDEYEMHVSGMVEETSIFGNHLRLTREITSHLGENRIFIMDIVENVGFNPAPHMLLYHFNFGFPLLTEETEILFPSEQIIPRDEGTAVAGFDRWQAPETGYRERVYYHHKLITRDNWAEAVIKTPRFPLGNGQEGKTLTVRLGWSTKHLPRLVQWKMPGAGVHVLGIEPANCHVEGRALERERGTLVMLQPGETRKYELSINLEI